MKNKSIQVRLDPKLKDRLEKILAKIGIDMPTAVRIFFTKIVMTGGIPFPLNTDEEDRYTPAQLKAIDELVTRARKGKGLSGPFSSAKEMLADLHSKM